MIENLSINDIRSIFIWLKEHELEFDASKLHRDFSDGVNVAKILKPIYPRLVDLNNYPKCNSTSLKIKNWETLNFKVLSKIGLHLKDKRIMKLVKGKPGAIETLLHAIMTKEMEYRREHDTSVNLQEKIWAENDDIVTVNVKRVVDGQIVERPEKLILYSIYNEAVKKSQMLSEEIAVLAKNIEHKENLLKLKMQHFHEICDHLTTFRTMDIKTEPLCKSELPPLDLRGIIDSSSESSTMTDTRVLRTK